MKFSKIASFLILFACVDAFTAPHKNARTSMGSALRLIPELSSIDPTLLAGGAVAAVLGLGGVAAVGSMGDGSSPQQTKPVPTKPEVVDVSIPYDAAARLAYDEWRVANDKGDFDEGGFGAFKEIYEEATIGMVAYKQMERQLAAKKRSYQALENKLEQLENVGWGRQPQNAL